jgi:hypothetical protein
MNNPAEAPDGFLNRQTYLTMSRNVRFFMHLALHHQIPSAD